MNPPSLLSSSRRQVNTLFRGFLAHPWVRSLGYFVCAFVLLGIAIRIYLAPYPKNQPPVPAHPATGGIPTELLRLGEAKLRPLGATGSYDAFGLPVTGPFETTAPGVDPESKENLIEVANMLPIQGFWEGREVIIGGRVYRPGESFLIRTQRNVYRVTITRILPEGLEIAEEEGAPIRILWPPYRVPAGAPESNGITVYFHENKDAR